MTATYDGVTAFDMSGPDWAIVNDRLSRATPTQMAKVLAAGAAVAPPRVRSFRAVHTSGAVVTVLRDADGRFDRDDPLFTVESPAGQGPEAQSPLPGRTTSEASR